MLTCQSASYDKMSSNSFYEFARKSAHTSMNDTNTPASLNEESLFPEARLVIVRGPQAGEKIILKPGENLLGRDEGYILRDGRVSRRHAQIQFIDNEFLLTDLQSTNGTFVNGDQIHQPTSLQHGDTIRLGDTILILRVGGEIEDDPSVVGARTPESKLDRGETTLMVGRISPDQAENGLSKKTEDSKGKTLPDPNQ